jgi:hypothetical protein
MADKTVLKSDALREASRHEVARELLRFGIQRGPCPLFFRLSLGGRDIFLARCTNVVVMIACTAPTFRHNLAVRRSLPAQSRHLAGERLAVRDIHQVEHDLVLTCMACEGVEDFGATRSHDKNIGLRDHAF